MFFTYIECTTRVIIWLISSNKHLCFYYIDAVTSLLLYLREIATGQITECGKLSDKKMRQIIEEYQYPDFEEDND